MHKSIDVPGTCASWTCVHDQNLDSRCSSTARWKHAKWEGGSSVGKESTPIAEHDRREGKEELCAALRFWKQSVQKSAPCPSVRSTVRLLLSDRFPVCCRIPCGSWMRSKSSRNKEKFRRVSVSGRWPIQTRKKISTTSVPRSTDHARRISHRRLLQIERGAETIVTQPPLDLDHFDQWWEMLKKSEMPMTADIMIGIPMISSVKIFQFWCQLCEISYWTVMPDGMEDTPSYWFEWNRSLLQRVTLFTPASSHTFPSR